MNFKDKANRSLLVMAMITFINIFGYGIIVPLLPFVAENFGANVLQIGLLVAIYSAFQFISAPIMGRLSDVHGRKLLLVVSQLGSAIGFIIFGLAGSLELLFLSRIIDGITGGNISIAQAYVADVTGKKERVRGMGIIGAAYGLGYIMGPATGGIISRLGFGAPFFLAAILSLITSLATVFLVKETISQKPSTRVPLIAINRLTAKNLGIGSGLSFFYFSYLIFNISQSIVYSLFGIWAEESYGFGPTEVGLTLAMTALIAVTIQLRLLARLVHAVGETRSLRYAALSLGVGVVSLSFPGNFTLWFAVPLIAFGIATLVPTIQSVVSQKNKVSHGKVLGTLESYGALGRIIGPVVGGELFFLIGKDIPFSVAGALMIAVFIYLSTTKNKISIN